MATLAYLPQKHNLGFHFLEGVPSFLVLQHVLLQGFVVLLFVLGHQLHEQLQGEHLLLGHPLADVHRFLLLLEQLGLLGFTTLRLLSLS